MKPPVWLLDVDGVINAVSRKPPRQAMWQDTDWSTQEVNGFPILTSAPVLTFLRKVDADGLAEIRWLTTWEIEDLCRTALAPALNLPEWPIAGRAVDHPVSGWDSWWKLPAAQKVHAEDPDRPLLWTDDDIPYCRAAKEWCGSWPDRKVFAVAPSAETGLTRKHITRIDEWLTGWAEHR